MKIVIIITLFFFTAIFADTGWTGIRDGIIHFRSSTPSQIRVSWKSVWAADGNSESLYFLSPNGRLINKIDIPPGNGAGSSTIRTTGEKGDYRLYIPGYSFREYSVSAEKSLKTVFKPVRHHFCMNAKKDSRFYFRISGKDNFQLCGKYHGGGDSIVYSDPSGQTHKLILHDYGENEYHQNDRISITKGNSGYWTCEPGSGKTGFWIDDEPNIFSLDTASYFEPVELPQKVSIRVSNKVAGHSPAVGSLVPERNLDANQISLVQSLNLKSAAFYAIKTNLELQDSTISPNCKWYGTYTGKLGITTISTMFSWGLRSFDKGVIDSSLIMEYALFINSFLSHVKSHSEWKIHHAGIFDEPNLRFGSIEQYLAFLDIILPAIDSIRIKDPSVSISLPEASGMCSGPLHANAKDRIGLVWLERLLKDYWHRFDAISWHEWSVRHLIETDYYASSVEKVWELSEKYRPKGSKPKHICITQTNIAPGSTTSPYEQDSFYSALWIASAVTSAASTGKLAVFNWLPLADEYHIRKGLIARPGGKLLKRPAAYAISFVNDALLDSMLITFSDSPEINFTASISSKKDSLSLIIVNKSNRLKTVSLAIDTSVLPTTDSLNVTAMRLDSLCKPYCIYKNIIKAGHAAYDTIPLNAPAIYSVLYVPAAKAAE